jgi:AcrR family transcriptional regulator
MSSVMSTDTQPRTRRTQAERLEISGRKLLDAAAALVAEKGWDATTAAEIGRRAGYSRSLVHRRYGSKDALLDTLLRSEYELRFSPAPDPAATGLEQVLALLDQFEKLFREDPEFLASMFIVSFEAVKRGTSVRPRIIARVRQLVDNIEQALRVGVQDGSVRPDTDVRGAVNEILASGWGIAYGWIVLPERFELPQELSRMRNRIIETYRRPRQPARR